MSGAAVAQHPRGADHGKRHERRYRAARQLKGDRAGTWSISASGNWLLTFDIRQNEICDLDSEDCH
jgi:plasmid maintenance system killer protein